MFKLLRAIFRDLPRLVKAAESIAAALDRAIPLAPPAPQEVLVFMTDPDEEEARMQAYEAHIGRPLYPNEEVPSDFQTTDPSGILSAFLGKGKKGH